LLQKGKIFHLCKISEELVKTALMTLFIVSAFLILHCYKRPANPHCTRVISFILPPPLQWHYGVSNNLVFGALSICATC